MNIDQHVVMVTSSLVDELNYAMNKATDDIMVKGTNANVETARCIVDLAMSQAIASNVKKRVDNAKKQLNETFTSEVVGAGQQKVLFDHHGLCYSKKRNKDTLSIDVNMLCNELAKAGVDAYIVEQCKKAATKPRKGNTYYQVMANEG